MSRREPCTRRGLPHDLSRSDLPMLISRGRADDHLRTGRRGNLGHLARAGEIAAVRGADPACSILLRRCSDCRRPSSASGRSIWPTYLR
jgi:hypothetical protein